MRQGFVSKWLKKYGYTAKVFAIRDERKGPGQELSGQPPVQDCVFEKEHFDGGQDKERPKGEGYMSPGVGMGELVEELLVSVRSILFAPGVVGAVVLPSCDLPCWVERMFFRGGGGLLRFQGFI